MQDESFTLDPQMDYNAVDGLSSEVKEKLAKVRPATIVSILLFVLAIFPWTFLDFAYSSDLQGAARRMEGITPISIVLLMRHARQKASPMRGGYVPQPDAAPAPIAATA